MLQKAQAELEARLKRAEGLGGPGKDSFTAAQLRATLAQVRAVTAHLKANMETVVTSQAKSAAGWAADSAVSYLKRAEQHFKGSTERLNLEGARVIDKAVAGANTSVLRRLLEGPDDRKKGGILQRYGEAVVTNFEERLQQRLVQKKPLDEVRAELIQDSPFLQGAPAHWAERIVRTEVMHAENTAILSSIHQADEQMGDMVKIISSTFDGRTGSDSYAVHGQIRRPKESFDSWFGSYAAPPDRPNDRSVVVPHRISWPIPASLKWKSDSEISARWHAERRKGSPPVRPKMTTVPIEEFGKPQPLPKSQAQPPTIEKQPIAEQDRKRPLAWQPKHPIAEVERPLPRMAPERVSAAPILHTPEPKFNPVLTKVSGQSGSNPGGVYEGTDGVQRYVKFYKDPAQAVGEHLAASLYADLGLGGLKTITFQHDDGTAFASEILPEVKTLGSLGSKLTKAQAMKALEGFAADVLTANWDAAGLGLDNMVLDREGNVRRIDNGAAFLTRAQGARKPVHALENVTEWETLFDPNKNPGYAKLAKAAGVTGPEGLKTSILKTNEKIQSIANAPGGWAKYVTDRAHGMSTADQQQIVDMLEARSEFLRVKAVELGAKKPTKPRAAKGAPKPPKPISRQEINDGKVDYLNKLWPSTHYLNGQPQLSALKAYTGSSYRPMNEHLLGKNPDSYVAELVQKTQDLLIAAKKEGHAVKGVVLRGIAVSDDVLAKINASETMCFEAFTSTTVNRTVAEGFAHARVGRPHKVLFQIRQSSAIPVDKVSVNGGEAEALLPHGARFRVVSRAVKDGFNVIDLEEI